MEHSLRTEASRRQALGAKLATAMVAGLGVMMAFGCSPAADGASSSSSTSSGSTAIEQPAESAELVLTMEYSDGSDMYDHKSVEVEDESIIAEGTQFVNGLGEENTYIYKGFAHGDNAHYSMYSLYTELITDDEGNLTAINLTSGADTWANRWGDLGANPVITGYLPDGASFEYTEKDGVITPQLTVESGSEADAAGYGISGIYLYNVQDDLTTVGMDVEGRRGTTHYDYDASVALEDAASAVVDDDDDDEAAASGKGGKGEGASAEGSSEGRGDKGSVSEGSSEGHGDKGSASEGSSEGRGNKGDAAASEGSSEGGHGGKGDAAAESAGSAESTAAPSGYSYDTSTGAITIEDGAYNLIQIQYLFGTETTFNEFIVVGDSEAAAQYLEKNFEDTDLTVIDAVDNTGVTNRTKWTYSMLSLMVQREFASWASTFEDESLYTGGNDGEIGDIDTISGATKTSVPFQSALNQAIKSGYITGISENLVATIDGGSAAKGSDGIDVTDVPQDQTSVALDESGRYVVTLNFPAGIDESGGADGGQHAIAPNNVELYALGDEDLGALGVWNLGKGTAGYTPVAAYADSSREPGDADDSYATYVSDWEYPYTPTLTVKDPSVTHVVAYYTIGHETLGIAYDLAAMVEASEVQALIDELGSSSDSAAVKTAREAYDNLGNDVKGFVSIDKLVEAEGK